MFRIDVYDPYQVQDPLIIYYFVFVRLGALMVYRLSTHSIVHLSQKTIWWNRKKKL